MHSSTRLQPSIDAAHCTRHTNVSLRHHHLRTASSSHSSPAAPRPHHTGPCATRYGASFEVAIHAHRSKTYSNTIAHALWLCVHVCHGVCVCVCVCVCKWAVISRYLWVTNSMTCFTFLLLVIFRITNNRLHKHTTGTDSVVVTVPVISDTMSVAIQVHSHTQHIKHHAHITLRSEHVVVCVCVCVVCVRS